MLRHFAAERNLPAASVAFVVAIVASFAATVAASVAACAASFAASVAACAASFAASFAACAAFTAASCCRSCSTSELDASRVVDTAVDELADEKVNFLATSDALVFNSLAESALGGL
jgi:hypothetical protein